MENDRGTEQDKGQRPPGGPTRAERHWDAQWSAAPASKRAAREPGTADGGYTGDDLAASYLGCSAGLAAVPVVGVCVLLLVHAGVAHWIAYFTIGAVVPGMAVSSWKV